jgi:hypothetical protein
MIAVPSIGIRVYITATLMMVDSLIARMAFARKHHLT